MNTKHIIYQTSEGSSTEFELEFIEKVLFSKVPHQNYFDRNTLSLVKNNSIIIYSTDKFLVDKKFLKYIYSFENFILLHLSNESQWHTTFYYKRAQAVIRTASWNIFTSGNVYTFPLGFQSGFLNTNKEFIDIKNRDFIWCFCGQIKSDRKEMMRNFTDINPNFSFNNSGWLSNESLSTSELINVYENSIFALCPLGNINFECFRTMEVLEYGCIPVTTEFLGRDCYKYIYGDHPFIVAKDWKNAKEIMKNLLNNPSNLEKKQKEVWDWYQNFKLTLSNDILKIINRDTASIEGKQFLYQKEVKSDILFKIKFINHFFINRLKTKIIRCIFKN